MYKIRWMIHIRFASFTEMTRVFTRARYSDILVLESEKVSFVPLDLFICRLMLRMFSKSAEVCFKVLMVIIWDLF